MGFNSGFKGLILEMHGTNIKKNWFWILALKTKSFRSNLKKKKEIRSPCIKIFLLKGSNWQ